jgi:hypothetical protein
VKYLVSLVIPITVSATDMTTRVEVFQYEHGAWRFTNTTDKHLRCNIGLTEYSRLSTSVMPKSPTLDKPFKVPGTIGNRNFSLEPYDTFVYSRKNVGTVHCRLDK